MGLELRGDPSYSLVKKEANPVGSSQINLGGGCMEIADAQEFLKNNHRGVLVARKKDGSLQMTLVSPVIDAEGKVIITSRETTFKVKNIKRNPQISYTESSLTVPNTFRSTVMRRSSPYHRPWISSSTGIGRSEGYLQTGTKFAKRRRPKGASPCALPLKGSDRKIEGRQRTKG